MKRTIFLKVYSGYLAVIAFLAAAVLVFAPPLMRNDHVRIQSRHLEHLAYLIEGKVLPHLAAHGAEELDDFVSAVGGRTGRRVTIIDREGRVLADSEKQARDMENHFFRPEIFAALQGEKRMSIRHSATLQTDMMYMSVPLEEDGVVVGVLRMSLFMKDLEALLAGLRSDLLKVVGLAALLGLVMAFFFTRTIAGPIRELAEAAARVSGGDFGAKVSTRRAGEFRDLARGFNEMTEKLRSMFAEIRIRGEELTSILASIREGLCVMDAESRILFCNDGFRRAVRHETPEGKPFWEVVRSSALAEAIREVRQTRSGAETEADVGDRTYFCSASYLTSQHRIVLTLHDVTEFRELERIKKDFVLNVSHELMTPLTAIKGFVETMEQRAEGENRTYLGIIRRNADRLMAIVDDLRALSEVEAKEPRREKEEVDIRALAESIMNVFQRAASEKGLEMALEAESGLPRLKADPVQLEGLLLNLIDNAVKYTDRGRVTIRLATDDGKARIEVVDTGIGIDAAHQPHVFERFYVVDRSRSRKLGGTGLGLSIVKHIALAHGGTVSVRSRLGEGSIFTVLLPLA